MEIYTIWGRAKFGKLCFYHSFGAIFRQTRFFNTQEREYACPVAWGLRQKFKIEKCWIFTLTTFSDRLYINRGHPAMGIAISILPIHRDGGLLCYHKLKSQPLKCSLTQPDLRQYGRAYQRVIVDSSFCCKGIREGPGILLFITCPNITYSQLC